MIFFYNYYKKIENMFDSMLCLYEDLDYKLNLIIERGEEMSIELENLEAKIAEQVEVTTSAIALIEGLADMLRDAGTDPVKLAELTDKLDASVDSLAAAVAANTVAHDEVPVEEPVVEEPAVEEEVPVEDEVLEDTEEE